MSYLLRELLSDTTSQKHWVIFDGPVDHLWIESINSLLDDNRKLCLANGQILNLNSHIKLIFETDDLISSSPSTVSRLGVLYMEPST